MLSLDLNETAEQRLRRENAALMDEVASLRNKITKIQLEMAFQNLELVDEPARTVVKEIPAKFEIRKVRR